MPWPVMPFGFIGASVGKNFLIYGRLPPATIEVFVVGGGGNSNGAGGGGGGGVRPIFSITTNMIGSPPPSEVCSVVVGGVNQTSSFTFKGTAYTATGGSGGGDNGGSQGSPNGYGGGAVAYRSQFGITNGGGGGGWSGGGGGGFVSSFNWDGGYVGRTCDWAGRGAQGYPVEANMAAVTGSSYVGSGGGGRSSGGNCPNSATGGTGAASGGGGSASMYGCGGGGGGGAGRQGIVVVRYTGQQAAPGGVVSYRSQDNKTYHVFTSGGTLEL